MPPGVTNYSIDVDGGRIPTIVPGNESLRSAVVLGQKRRLTNEEVQNAINYTRLHPDQFTQGPMSPLGSEFDMPSRVFEQPNIYKALGQLFGGNWLTNQIAYPEQRRVGLREQITGVK